MRENERDGALAEARTGFFFNRNGFRITDWTPEAVKDRPGDMEIQWRDTESLFVEVKGPGWEGELSPEEIRAGRQFLPKYINAEGRAVGPTGRVLYAVDKALPKLAPERINLVVVVDDLFLSPTELPRNHLTGVIARELTEARYSAVSAVFLLNPVSYSGAGLVEYRKYFIPNEGASRRLPEAVHEGLLVGNLDPQGPRWSRD